MEFWIPSNQQNQQSSTLHYINAISNATFSDLWCISKYMLYEIQTTGLSRKLATQKVRYDQQRKSAAQITATLGIISQMAPREFKVRTTTDEFNV